MGLLSRFRKVTEPLRSEPAYRECRSWNGSAFHIRATGDYSGLALCGYDPLDDASAISLEDLNAREPMQHEGWHYCPSCVKLFRVEHED